MAMEYRFSLTPRLVAVGLFSLVALFVLLFLLGMQVGIRTAKPAESAPVSAVPTGVADPLAAAQKKAVEAEAALKQVVAPAQPAPAAPAAPAAKP
jgi:hypothetical protein